MACLGILCIATIAVIVPLNRVAAGNLAPGIDINQILDLVQKQRQGQQNTGVSKQRRIQLRQDSTDSDESAGSDSDYLSGLDISSYDSDDDNNRHARIEKERIIDLIEKVANEKNNELQNEDRIINRKGKASSRLNNIVNNKEKYDNSQIDNILQTQILEQLLSRGIIDEERKKNGKSRKDRPKMRLKPNRLTGTNDVRAHPKNKDITGLDEYSKVYIVLNPQAVRQSKNKNALNELVSKVLDLASPNTKTERQGKKKSNRYKEIVLNNDHLSRRSRRESKETYGNRDSMADDYNAPKRSRGGGGSLGGHTAIPYIRHRGDIYERDN